ncbi:MAG: substrate-binding domain-containing protein [Butyricicoccus porcorum]|nr:substrate-binding domain-containing protein [Butyricicoccus porcorum]
MKRRSRWAAALAVCTVLGLAGCGSGTAQNSEPVEGLDQLGDIRVIAREDGSGTRAAFAQLVDFEGDVADAQQSDQTRKDAQIAQDTEEVIQAVEDDAAAIGYISRGSMSGASKVKALTVNGTSVDAKSYPLRRSFYLTYCGGLNELEEDFLTYIRSAGQDIVGKSYTQVAKTNTFLSNQAEGTISIAGSTSVAPLMRELAEAYEQINPHADITITETDSTDGLTQAMSGQCDLGMSSRDLKDYEQELLDYQVIAQDEIAVIVNAENPLQDIGLDTLRQIYTGKINVWNELNS